ncbi:MAG: hypothetical protein EP146_05635 [Oscillibacter sp.]|uniref:hypothetical protein n=1 Tax=Oscillibacter sp. TaxID=1945593 RepID=UPI0013240458|nr:hypothetical protein [Oscillibacter sp.]MUU10885.1 hypothetical protein [Oscillibacter sp.]
MEATKQNYKLARQIIEMFAKENCTVKQSEEVLAFVGMTIRNVSTVQLPEQSAEVFNRAENL